MNLNLELKIFNQINYKSAKPELKLVIDLFWITKPRFRFQYQIPKLGIDKKVFMH